jgi:hypothetical protein
MLAQITIKVFYCDLRRSGITVVGPALTIPPLGILMTINGVALLTAKFQSH